MYKYKEIYYIVSALERKIVLLPQSKKITLIEIKASINSDTTLESLIGLSVEHLKLVYYAFEDFTINSHIDDFLEYNEILLRMDKMLSNIDPNWNDHLM
jgi:hypothetical protein